MRQVYSYQTKWCSLHKSPCPESDFTGTERSCKQGKFEYHIKRKYGLSLDEFENLKNLQGNSCASCGNRGWRYIDHNHITGKVRGLLCPRCNTLVGFLETSPTDVERAVNYIARNE